MKVAEVFENPVESAIDADLIYVHDDLPGFSRKLVNNVFNYFDIQQNVINDELTIKRIRSLAIPPAYTKVWICPLENGHIQATGYDAKGRKQYRYHPRWRTFRTEINHARMIEFGKVLPLIRKKVDLHLRSRSIHKQTVLATIVKLLDLTLIRVGNEEYAKKNHSYGLTTLRDRHVTFSGDVIHFEFKGKSSKYHQVDVNNKRLAALVKKCMEIPGYELFQYYDDNKERHSIESTDVNTYLHEISGSNFTAKDFRTWWATVLAMVALRTCEAASTKREVTKNLSQAIKTVAQKMGNTPAVCKKNYIYSGLLESYATGSFTRIVQDIQTRTIKKSELSFEEVCTLEFIKRSMKIT